MRHALNSLAVATPEWLRQHSQLAWIDRYRLREPEVRIPTGKQQRLDFAEMIGRDGEGVLLAVYAEPASLWLRELPAVEILWQV